MLFLVLVLFGARVMCALRLLPQAPGSWPITKNELPKERRGDSLVEAVAADSNAQEHDGIIVEPHAAAVGGATPQPAPPPPQDREECVWRSGGDLGDGMRDIAGPAMSQCEIHRRGRK